MAFTVFFQIIVNNGPPDPLEMICSMIFYTTIKGTNYQPRIALAPPPCCFPNLRSLMCKHFLELVSEAIESLWGSRENHGKIGFGV